MYSLVFNSAKAAREVCLFVAVGICGISWVEHAEDLLPFFFFSFPKYVCNSSATAMVKREHRALMLAAPVLLVGLKLMRYIFKLQFWGA